MHPTLPPGDYETLRATFRWAIPARLNMARQACFDWADSQPDRAAIIDLSGGARRDVTYGQLAAMTRGLAAHLAGQGVRAGDRVGVLRSQDAWCAAGHLAIWSLGAISVPLLMNWRVVVVSKPVTTPKALPICEVTSK